MSKAFVFLSLAACMLLAGCGDSGPKVTPPSQSMGTQSEVAPPPGLGSAGGQGSVTPPMTTIEAAPSND